MPGYPTQPEANPSGPLVTFNVQGTIPPTAVYVGPDDSLVLVVSAPSVSGTIQLFYRLLTPEGDVVANPQTFQYSPTAPGGNNFLIPPSEGFLLSATVWAPSTFRGQVFAQLFINRGSSPVAPTNATVLCQGYTSNAERLCYPVTPTQSSLEGRGWTHTVYLTNPGVGLNYFVIVPPGVVWRLKAAFFNFQASAAVLNRFAFVLPSPPPLGPQYLIALPSPMTAGTFWQVTLAEGVQTWLVANHNIGPLATDILFPSNTQINMGITTPDAADQLSNGSLTVEEWVNF